MSNGDLMSYLTLHPEYNRIAAVSYICKTFVIGQTDVSDQVSQLAEGMNDLHSLQPPIIHGDIKGVRIFYFL